RSIHNVGSLLRTGEVFAIDKVYVTGFTPHPSHPGDQRDAQLQEKQTRRMSRASAGAEQTMPLEHHGDVHDLLRALRADGYTLTGLEIDSAAIEIGEYPADQRVALVLGDEAHGIERRRRQACEGLLQIPVHGRTIRLNSSAAVGSAVNGLQTRGEH